MAEAKEFSIGACMTAVQDKCLCPFGDFHELAEWLLGHPIWTHEFVDFAGRIRAAMLAQHGDLAKWDTSGINRDNVHGFIAQLEREHGKTLVVAKGASERTESPMESAKRMFGDATVIPVVVKGGG